MHLLALLGKYLKSDDVIDVLECMEMEVVYDFDRLHEGQPDKYWATSKEAGIQLGFDTAQALEIIFLYLTPRDGFSAFSQRDCDVPLFATTADVQTYSETQRLLATKGRADFLGVSRDWVRNGFVTHSIHYEFHRGSLALVRITRSEH
jgi:hypothetical protein